MSKPCPQGTVTLKDCCVFNIFTGKTLSANNSQYEFHEEKTWIGWGRCKIKIFIDTGLCFFFEKIIMLRSCQNNTFVQTNPRVAKKTFCMFFCSCIYHLFFCETPTKQSAVFWKSRKIEQSVIFENLEKRKKNAHATAETFQKTQNLLFSKSGILWLFLFVLRVKSAFFSLKWSY